MRVLECVLVTLKARMRLDQVRLNSLCLSGEPFLPALTVRAVVRSAAGNGNLANPLAAAHAGFIFAAVGSQLLLEHPHLALTVDVGFDRAAALLHRFLQHMDDRFVQPFPLGPGKAIRRALRMDAGREQRFICIDIADADDIELIEQQGFDLPLAMSQHGAEALQGKVRIKRLQAQLVQRGILPVPPPARTDASYRTGAHPCSEAPSHR